jgi:hypothetical protein
MIQPNNLWEKDALRKHTSVADVEAQMARVTHGIEVAPTAAKKNEWQRKLNFLLRLREQLAGGRGL